MFPGGQTRPHFKGVPVSLKILGPPDLRPIVTKFGVVTRVSSGQPQFHIRGCGTMQRTKIFGTSYTCGHSARETATKFCSVIKLNERKMLS